MVQLPNSCREPTPLSHLCFSYPESTPKNTPRPALLPCSSTSSARQAQLDCISRQRFRNRATLQAANPCTAGTASGFVCSEIESNPGNRRGNRGVETVVTGLVTTSLATTDSVDTALDTRRKWPGANGVAFLDMPSLYGRTAVIALDSLLGNGLRPFLALSP